MPFIAIGDAEIHYEIHGTGEPLLFVTGLGGAASYWGPQLEEFSRRYTVVLHDHRGTGESTKSLIKYSVNQMAEDLVALMDGLNINRAHVVGHSTGGAIGQILAAKFPSRIKSFVAYATWAKADAQMNLCFDARRSLLDSGGARAFCHSSPLFLYPPWYNHDKADYIAVEEDGSVAKFPPASIMTSRIEAILAFDSTKFLRKINTPTLVLCAEDDILTPSYLSRELAGMISGAALKIVARGGHAFSRTLPEEFNSIVLDFLQQQQSVNQ